MKGMELARDDFMQYGRPMLEERFGAYMSHHNWFVWGRFRVFRI